ncbi:uncharacterized protein RCC_06255 [Ramularia collo-cygni]|uniref:Zn(2)-C6 fungal-type domain-containing protein n=1 Tax=Ramularia collo-cygni TaxID=112498 RepID=A0A2D3V104_9PEZI|nr:uncharacterized protein RCC_06255 [Ramularia collo-cygni]CZT20395.1 uncharacterized protein RCC_06255 [Ramularia collo-cygni]
MSGSDARNRNRLGYQRSTIACAHCRRRKIRCVVSEDEPGQRCINCIRLRRDCVFYPVDQQSALEAESDTSSRITRIPSTASSTISSSSPHLGARMSGQPGRQQGIHHLEAKFPATGVPILPSTGPHEPGDFNTLTAQRDQSGLGHLVPGRAGSTQQDYRLPAWEPRNDARPSQHSHLPMEGASNVQSARLAYNNPALQADTAPFPGPSDIDPRRPYIDDGFYNHHSVHMPLQQWQQHEHPNFGPQYHQSGPFYHSAQQAPRPSGAFPLTTNSGLMMATSHVPHAVPLPHHMTQPSQISQSPAGYYQQAPAPWQLAQQPPAPQFDDQSNVGHPDERTGGYG